MGNTKSAKINGNSNLITCMGNINIPIASFNNVYIESILSGFMAQLIILPLVSEKKRLNFLQNIHFQHSSACQLSRQLKMKHAHTF